MEKLDVPCYKVSLLGNDVAKVPLGGLEQFIVCVLRSNDSVCISLDSDTCNVSLNNSAVINNTLL